MLRTRFLSVAALFVLLFSCSYPSFGQDIVENDVVRILFDNDKGSIVGVTLLSKKYNNLSILTAECSVFETPIGTVEKARFTVANKGSESITFESETGNIKIIKEYKLSSYKVYLDLSYKNVSDKQISLEPVIRMQIVSNPSEIDESIVNFDGDTAKKLEDKSYEGGEIKELGLDKRYSAAFFKTSSTISKYVIGKIKAEKTELKDIQIFLPAMMLEAGDRIPCRFEMFAGPKEEGILETYKYQKILDTGTISRILLFILRFFYGMFNNWGISIIMLTIAVKVILYPLNAKQNKSMAEMQKIQPLVEDIKKKYGNDKERMNQEVLQLYREHKINPFGGCLPLLIQLPILFALFSTLRTSIELKGEGFLWISDLSGPEYLIIGNSQIPVLAIVIAVSTYLQMKMQNTGNNPQQSNMMMIMPVMMFFLCQALPAGVLIYWFVSNILAMMQTKLDYGKIHEKPAVIESKAIETCNISENEKSPEDSKGESKKSNKKKKGAKKDG